MSAASTRIKTFRPTDLFLPLDKSWCAFVRVSTGPISAYGATREEAIANLKDKLAKLNAQKVEEAHQKVMKEQAGLLKRLAD